VKATYDEVIREKDDEDNGQVVVDEMYQARYYIKRNHRNYYEVRDSETDEVVVVGETELVYPHKGKAWQKAHEMNKDA
jgi:hypothetical protein